MRSLIVLCGFLTVFISATPTPGLLSGIISNPLSRWQATAVRGRLTCNGKAAGNVKLKLYDVDTVPDIDDLMKEGFSNADGSFELVGKEKEWTTIDPKLNIYHRCNYDGRCFQKVEIVIPKDFVVDGELSTKYFDIGEINLASGFSGDSTDCFN
ncbi:unnamed protein product, partial [Mesorhabditis belari]|uniref:Transthyretin-like family protein n=1 Tax=Mesorhabditis belari TaxID=2138241 RepID=A0AAF3EN33_9BILA